MRKRYDIYVVDFTSKKTSAELLTHPPEPPPQTSPLGLLRAPLLVAVVVKLASVDLARGSRRREHGGGRALVDGLQEGPQCHLRDSSHKAWNLQVALAAIRIV